MNSRIYLGEVRHTRLAPVPHHFRYPVYFYALDLDELEELARRIPFFGYNQLRPVAIHDKDYLLPGRESVREKLAGVLSRAGMDLRLGRVVMVTAARYFNYIFNPISYFYCYDATDRLACVIAQVNNTFGEMHLYFLAMEGVEAASGRFNLKSEKAFHVSPFFPPHGRYEFSVSEPQEEIDNAIRYYLNEQLSLVAQLRGQGRPLSAWSLAATIVGHPFTAALTMPRILWQAARLRWQRRLPVYRKPIPASPMTVRPAPPHLLDRLGMRVALNFLARLPQGELKLQTPDGREYRLGKAGSEPALHLRVREFSFFRRIMFSGDIGFGEGFTQGEWTTDDLPNLLTLLAANERVMNDRLILPSSLGRIGNYLRHLLRFNSVKGASRNIRQHYDLSNEFFATFLDETMTYSCAIFEQEGDDLERAQRNKMRSVIQKAGIGPQDHVLEIGCGWGGFAIEAVRQTGCRVTGITVSQAQLELARERVRAAGLEDRIDLRLCDYRRIPGQYSKVVSIEMLEAVGHAGLGRFFAACDRALLPGGKGVFQVITIPDHKYTAYRYSSDWIRKHIFPGGHLPSLGALSKAIGKHSALRIEHLENLGPNYVKTLACWSQALDRRSQEVHDLGFDESFVRKWQYYFAYCQAGFDSGIIDLAQVVVRKPLSRGMNPR